ncbi:MAG: glycoside-pentoside-hexuronide (GPH):cation symporter [Chloroflexi bacterium]|nr:glycoside-pentoside-hexuronide (GPH):cation symporter [Chloroflexota bacterium]MCI0646036.1 glycoside-pentoside-hexuronide (GPH):cation symporter [Chloroflexota bacterium]
MADERATQGTMVGARKLSWRTKFVYGLGDWGTSAATTTRNLFWLFFLVNVVGLRIELAGVAVLVGKIWDGFNDPLIGTISDRLQTRWGRRRPFLLFGAVPFGMTFFLLFIAPPIQSEIGLALYYGLMFVLFDTLYTIINVPYTALTSELTRDYDERSSLAGWRIATSIFAALVAGATFKQLAEQVLARELFIGMLGMDITTAIRGGYALTAALWGITLAIPPLILFKAIEEPPYTPPEKEPLRPWQTFKEVFSNRPFRLAALIYLLTFSTADIIVNVIVWFLHFYVRVEPGFDSKVLAVVLGLAFVTMPLTVQAMRHYGKRNTYIGAMGFLAVVMLIISQTPPGGQNFILWAAPLAGLGYGAANVIPWAIVADVVEEDELRTGKRREGVYAGYLVFFRKLATAGSIFVVTTVLAAAGFQEGTTGSQFIEQPAGALAALRFFVGVAPAGMLVLSIAAAWRYPLNREAHEEIRRQLARRKAVREGGSGRGGE